MIAHLQHRREERTNEETMRAEELDKTLADLERQEYELLVALEGHKAERALVHQQIDAQLAAQQTTSSASGVSLLPPVA